MTYQQPRQDAQNVPQYGYLTHTGQWLPPTPDKKGWSKKKKIWTSVGGGFLILAVCSGIINSIPGSNPAPSIQSPSATAPSPSPNTTTSSPIKEDSATISYSKVSSRQWKKISRDPDAYAGKRYVVYGYVTQADANTGTSAIRADVDGVKHSESYEYDNNAILGGTEGQVSELVEGDFFKAEVRVISSFSYETALGGELSVPLLYVDSVKVFN